MFLLKKIKPLLIFIYAFISIYFLDITNCEGLTDVCDQDISKIDKTIGWTFLIGTVLFVLFIIYFGTPPTDSTQSTSIMPQSVVAPLPNDSINNINPTDPIFWVYLELYKKT